MARHTVSGARISIRLPNAAHLSNRWRIREIVPDFTLEDVWALPAYGSAEDFQTLIETLASFDPANSASLPVRALFRFRDHLGRWFGLDRVSAPDRQRWGWRRRQTADSRCKRNLPGYSLAGRPAQHRRGSAFRNPAFRAHLSHQRRVRRGNLEPDHAWRDAPGVGRSGRRPLPRADGRLRQATRCAREGIHGAHQAVPPLDRLSSPHAADRTSLERTDARGRHEAPRSHQAKMIWRRRGDSNRRWGFCRPLP